MSARKDALWRILGLAYFATIGWVVLAIAAVAAIFWMVTDVVVQLLLGKEALPQSNNPATQFLKRLWSWGEGQLNYVLFGEGEFPFLP